MFCQIHIHNDPTQLKSRENKKGINWGGVCLCMSVCVGNTNSQFCPGAARGSSLVGGSQMPEAMIGSPPLWLWVSLSLFLARMEQQPKKQTDLHSSENYSTFLLLESVLSPDLSGLHLCPELYTLLTDMKHMLGSVDQHVERQERHQPCQTEAGCIDLYSHLQSNQTSLNTYSI